MDDIEKKNLEKEKNSAIRAQNSNILRKSLWNCIFLNKHCSLTLNFVASL